MYNLITFNIGNTACFRSWLTEFSKSSAPNILHDMTNYDKVRQLRLKRGVYIISIRYFVRA